MMLLLFFSVACGFCVSTSFSPASYSQNFTVPIQVINVTGSFTDVAPLCFGFKGCRVEWNV